MEKIKILYSPQRSDNFIFYQFEENLITVYFNDIVDTFDFSNFIEDGQIDLFNENGELLVETTLPFCPIMEAYRENGELFVTLLYRYGEIATDDEKFPVWTDYKEIKVGVYNGEN